MTAPPLVSILTPTYNHRLYIRQCIESVLAQTDGRWEQIVLDDDSTDDTGAIVSSFTDERIRYVHQEHTGIEHLADTYNKGLAMARGELIAVLEGDDFWPPDKLERQIPSFEDPDVVMSWGQVGRIDATGNVYNVFPRLPLPGSPAAGGPDRARILHRLLSGNFPPACTVMCRRDALLKIGGFAQPPGIPAADYATWLRLAALGRLAPMEGLYGFWRNHPAQITQVMEREMLAIPRLNWATWVSADLSDADRVQLGLTLEQAAVLDAARRARTDFKAGRRALRRNRRDEAAVHFSDAMHGGRGVAKAKAFVALVLTRLGLNLELLLKARDIVRRS